MNDQFKVLGTGLVTEFDCRIFDRAGQLVFQTKDKNKVWTGELKGKKLPAGMYVYVLQYKEINSPDKGMMKGTILLVR